MNNAQAMSKLKKLFGPKAAYRIDPRAPDADAREVAQARMPELIESVKITEAALLARRAVLLADPEYVKLRAEFTAAKDAKEKASSLTYWYRISAGVSSSLCFEIKAQGDTWNDVFAKLKERSEA